MSSRSIIIRQNNDGTLDGVYCNSDGYLTGVGATLYENYQSADKLQRLLKPQDDVDHLEAHVTDRHGRYTTHSFPILDKYDTNDRKHPFDTDNYPKNPKFKRLPKAEREDLAKWADVPITNYMGVPKQSNTRFMHWKSVDDLIASIHDKKDYRVDTIFIEYIYLYTSKGTWRFFYDIDGGLHTKKSLYSAVRHANAVDRRAERKRKDEEANAQAFNQLYSI